MLSFCVELFGFVRLTCLVKSFLCFRPQWTIEEVNVRDLFKSPFQSPQLYGKALRRRFQPFQVPNEFRIVWSALLAKTLLQRVRGQIINGLNLKHRSLALEPSNLRSEPLKTL